MKKALTTRIGTSVRKCHAFRLGGIPQIISAWVELEAAIASPVPDEWNDSSLGAAGSTPQLRSRAELRLGTVRCPRPHGDSGHENY